MRAEVLHSSVTNEWHTPHRYTDAVRHLFRGTIDLDPASSAIANESVRATAYFDSQADGLTKAWIGTVFLNPPYGKTGSKSNQQIWSERLIEQYNDNITREAVLLVNAVPSNKWFAPLWQFPICFTDHRIRYINPLAKLKQQPTHSNCFVYLGENERRFRDIFTQFGVVAKRMEG